MDTHYYNAYSDKGGFFIESKALTYDEAVQNIADNESLYYAYTLEISQNDVKRIDLESEGMDTRYPEYEALTGHELGLLHGRI